MESNGIPAVSDRFRSVSISFPLYSDMYDGMPFSEGHGRPF